MRDTLTGTRIRERRLLLGLRQAELAQRSGISASYLNLIEHNRRRIGGKILMDIARVLEVEPAMLTEGAEATLLAGLREAAEDATQAKPELDRAEEFAGRFPGWAEVIGQLHRRIGSLERRVETLSDRLTHDTDLAESLHEVLSTAASIRSTASILAEPGEVSQEWRDRFHANLNQDSARLAASSKELVRYLDQEEADEGGRRSPREAVEAFFAARSFGFPELETGSAVEQIVKTAPELDSEASRRIARDVLALYAGDARALPLAEMQEQVARLGIDILALMQHFSVPLEVLLRRLAILPEAITGTALGLVVIDGTGSFLFRKPITGFNWPRFGAGCGIWPVFDALTQTGRPQRKRVRMLGREGAVFDCIAVAHQANSPSFEATPSFNATMLIVPVAGEAEQAVAVGSTCRVCAVRECRVRREPSILREEGA